MSSPRSTHCSFHCSLVFTPPSPPRRDEIIGRRKLIDPIRWTERNGTDFRTDIAWTTIRVSRTRSTRVPFNWTRERQVAIIATGRVSILAERREKPNSPRVILIGPSPPSSRWPRFSSRGISYGRRDHVSITLFSLDDSPSTYRRTAFRFVRALERANTWRFSCETMRLLAKRPRDLKPAKIFRFEGKKFSSIDANRFRGICTVFA